MSRGLTDPVPEPEDNGQDTVEINQAIDELYTSHNMLHDRLVRLERELDHCACKNNNPEGNGERKFWKRGL